MDVYYEETCHINSRDADAFGRCRPSSLLGYLQEVATGAAVAGGFTRERLLAEHNCFWMLARIWCRLHRPLDWNQNLTVRTWHRGNPGMMMYRDFDLYIDNRPVGEAVSVWVLADMDDRKLLRMSRVPELQASSGGSLCKDRTVQKLRLPQGLAPAEERRLHYSDTDLNGHVNNSRYADFACDAIQLDRTGRGNYLSELQIGFLGECRAGETLSLLAGQEGEQWYAEGRCGGAVRFDASMTLAPLDKERNLA